MIAAREVKKVACEPVAICPFCGEAVRVALAIHQAERHGGCQHFVAVERIQGRLTAEFENVRQQ